MSDVNVYSATGDKKGTIALPDVFQTPARPDVVQKAVQAARANRRQPYGAHPNAGKQHATRSAGKGKGVSRVPRLTQGNSADLAPNVVGGRRAHPPEARRDWSEKINNKERKLAIASALAATANVETVKARGHKFVDGITLPVVVDDAVAKVEKTKDAIAALEKIGLGPDLERATVGRRIRAGMGKLRGRRYKKPRSFLFVTTDVDAAKKAFGNLSGVDITTPAGLNAEALAPGGDMGRLTVFTESALKALGGES